jgi:hypothetical protein
VRMLDRALGDAQQLTAIRGRRHPRCRNVRAIASHGRPFRGPEQRCRCRWRPSR